MKKITELTDEQESKFQFFVDKWLGIGLSTKLSDPDKILEYIPRYYASGGLEAPDRVIICQSPWAAVQYGASLLDDKIPLSNRLSDVWSSRVGMSLWSGYNSWRDYMGYIGVDISELEPAFQLAEECCYLFPYNNFVVVSEKPTEIHTNANGDMHNQYGLAIKWADNFGMYLLNGVRMCGAEWFFDASLSDDEKAKRINDCANTEQRVQMMKHLGYDKFLSVLSAKLIHENKLTEDKLYTLKIAGVETGPYLMMTCPSTRKVYFEGVGDSDKYSDLDPTIKSTDDAHIWRYKVAANNLLKNVDGFNISELEFNT